MKNNEFNVVMHDDGYRFFTDEEVKKRIENFEIKDMDVYFKIKLEDCSGQGIKEFEEKFTKEVYYGE